MGRDHRAGGGVWRLPGRVARFTPGFRLVVALDGDLVAGFAMGASWDPDNWWCEAVTRDLHPDMTRSCFHLMELALLPSYRGGGWGDVSTTNSWPIWTPTRRSCRPTSLVPLAAAALYINRGWQLLLRSWSHCDACPVVHVMGMILRPPG